jgi:hypothetical protein
LRRQQQATVVAKFGHLLEFDFIAIRAGAALLAHFLAETIRIPRALFRRTVFMAQPPHKKALTSPYLNGPPRFAVPDGKISWEVLVPTVRF